MRTLLCLMYTSGAKNQAKLTRKIFFAELLLNDKSSRTRKNGFFSCFFSDLPKKSLQIDAFGGIFLQQDKKCFYQITFNIKSLYQGAVLWM